MSFLPSLPKDATLRQVFIRFPEAVPSLMSLNEVLLRDASPFSPAQREMLAAYVSVLNQCNYCHGVHLATAEEFGLDPELLRKVLDDPETAPIDARFLPVLRYVRKLTETPAQMTQEDADAVFAAGWDERALYDAVMVCACFNFMNRMVDGLGVTLKPGWSKQSAQTLHDIGYTGLAAMVAQARKNAEESQESQESQDSSD